MQRVLSFRASEELAAKVEAESERRKITATDIIRQIVEAYFQQEKGQQKFETLLFEVAKTRAVILRLADMAGKALTDDLLEEAGKDAVEYVEQEKQSR